MESKLAPLLRLVRTGKSFGETPVLKDISLELTPGETLAVIGPSGCGKTTLLRCINLLEPITAGEIHFNGTLICRAGQANDNFTVSDCNQYRRQVGMVFQSLHLWPHLNVLDNVMTAPITLGLHRNNVRERAVTILEKVGIKEKMSDFPATLSGGQQQRVAIARALVMDPQLLLLDEITSALDPELVGEILDVILALCSSGTTMIVVTHEMQFAAEVANKAIFLDGGAIVESGNTKDLILSPRTQRLRAFLERIEKHRMTLGGHGHDRTTQH